MRINRLGLMFVFLIMACDSRLSVGTFPKQEPTEMDTLRPVTIRAIAPDGLTGDFFFNNERTCNDARMCEWITEQRDIIHVQIITPMHLFVQKEIDTGMGSNVIEVTWEETGTWGVAPHGKFVRIAGPGGVRAIKSWVTQDQVMMNLDDGLPPVTIHDHRFAHRGQDISRVGFIYPDMSGMLYLQFDHEEGTGDVVALKHLNPPVLNE